MAVYRELLRLHGKLVWMSFGFDLLLLICAAVFLLLPVSDLALTAGNAIFGIFVLIAIVSFEAHAIKECSGGPAFYLMLPTRRAPALLLVYGVFIAPFVVSSLALALAIFFVDQFIPCLPPTSDLLLKTGQVFVAFFFIKSLPLPTLVLANRHPVLPLFFYLLISVLGAIAFVFLPEIIPPLGRVGKEPQLAIFLMMVLLAELKVLLNPRP